MRHRMQKNSSISVSHVFTYLKSILWNCTATSDLKSGNAALTMFLLNYKYYLTDRYELSEGGKVEAMQQNARRIINTRLQLWRAAHICTV